MQIAVDVFAFPSQYMDLASLGALCKYTGGQLYMYPSFNHGGQDVPKLRHELDHNLTRTTGQSPAPIIKPLMQTLNLKTPTLDNGQSPVSQTPNPKPCNVPKLRHGLDHNVTSTTGQLTA